MKNLGILLKKYTPKKEKISVLDNSLGRIEATVKMNQIQALNHGALFSYTIESVHTNLYCINNIEILNVPFTLAKQDIYFFHHLLELCYYFLPLDIAYPSIFELIDTAFNHILNNKPIILLRFFTSLGIYPEELPFEKTYFLHLLSCPLQIILKEKLDDRQLKMLESWLLRCIEMHPYKKNFKTNYFVSRYYEKS